MSHEAPKTPQFDQDTAAIYEKRVRALHPEAEALDVTMAARALAIANKESAEAVSDDVIEAGYQRRLQTHEDLGSSSMVTGPDGVVLGRMNSSEIPGAIEDERRAA